ncbi:hypothetical protein ACG873_01360 (plasmid) [Mesorhizobium sp. AaZ16]|uniref:hypothetical protein n=1 Tax=Mesorhizobium sp. AaZ16 TaxID=3402289 RepID=UPI00374F1BD1
MDALTAATMVLLTCSPDATCSEMRGAKIYETITACREAMPSVVERIKTVGGKITARCELASDGLGIDPTVTGSIEADDRNQATVRVTRFIDGDAITEAYRVPRS